MWWALHPRIFNPCISDVAMLAVENMLKFLLLWVTCPASCAPAECLLPSACCSLSDLLPFPQVTCGGLQSAHTVAVAAACAERGLNAHLLVRGEQPTVPTGLTKHTSHISPFSHSTSEEPFLVHRLLKEVR